MDLAQTGMLEVSLTPGLSPLSSEIMHMTAGSASEGFLDMNINQ